jgi:two-component system sensor histidine kinase KdpD
VFVDLTPEALIQWVRAGKVYPGERVEAALNNFFKIENLAALREVALRQVAEEVEAKRLMLEMVPARDDERMLESAAGQAVGERLLVLVKPTPKSQRVVRRAWRSAQRLSAELDILWVSSHEPSTAEREQLEALRRLATLLGRAAASRRDHAHVGRVDPLPVCRARVGRSRRCRRTNLGRSSEATRRRRRMSRGR